MYQQGSWGQLRTLNRPAILTLIDDEGNAHQLVVSGLINDTAKINLPDETKLVSIAVAVATLVRRLPGVVAAASCFAARAVGGHAGRWRALAAQQAQHGGGKTEAPASDFYDEDLVKMVEDFQRQNRLNVDGIAGVQTQIVLDALGNTAARRCWSRTGSGRGAS